MTTIGTHSDYFHLDETFAIMMLKGIFPDAKVIRSRDPIILQTCNILVDVGGVYDPQTDKYDHHQTNFKEYYDNQSKKKGIIMSSAGLVFKHYGRRYVTAVYGVDNPSDDLLQLIYHKIIAAVDAIDNGISIYLTKGICKQTTLNTIISARNADDPFDHSLQNQIFADTVVLLHKIIYGMIKDTIKRFNARKADYKYICDYFDQPKSDKQILISGKYINTIHSSLAKYEAKHRTRVIYYIYKATEGKWRVRTINIKGTFTARKQLPDMETLRKNKISVDFVHPKRFLVGTVSRETAIQVAKFALI